MRKLLFFSFIFCFALSSYCQNTVSARPKLVVGIVVDQMRWDYLYRYYNRYAEDGGFKRLLNNGFSCENTMIRYTPTITACGHASIYTGSVPAINGITGNDWWDYDINNVVYCTEDENAETVGSNSALGQMSPKNLLVTTIGDELRLATNFKSKIIGIAIKDRSAILPAGHSANAAYWYDNKTGNWITSSYYMKDLPKWVKELNAKKLEDGYYAQDWNTLYPLNTYEESTSDEERYEKKPFGASVKGFPYSLKQFIGKNYSAISVTPYGNSFTFDMAKAALTNEQLGTDSITDMLTVSLSSPDYIGHTFGPNSVEAEDGFLRLDKDLGNFLNFLDETVGKDQYVVFLTADHGAAHVPGFLTEHKIPAGNVDEAKLASELNLLLKEKFKADSLVLEMMNYQVFLDRSAIKNLKLNKDSVDQTVIDFLLQQPGISGAFKLNELSKITLNATVKEAFINGYYPSRCGDIQIVYQPQWINDFLDGGTTHGLWNAYDAHIPLLWYGWHINTGKTNREVAITDIAPTIAAMLHIQMPSGCVGHVIEEPIK